VEPEDHPRLCGAVHSSQVALQPRVLLFQEPAAMRVRVKVGLGLGLRVEGQG
jgi:hypothetical protein